MVSWYDIVHLRVIMLTYLLGRLRLCHEAQSKKLTNYLFWQTTDPLWWNIFVATICAKNQSSLSSLAIRSLLSTQQSIYYRRRDAGISLSHLFGHRTNRSHPPLKTQWSLPIPHWAAHVSNSNNLTALPASNGSRSPSPTQKTPRPLTVGNECKTQPSSTSNLRSGLYRPYP